METLINAIKHNIEIYRKEVENYYNDEDSLLDEEYIHCIMEELLPKLEADLVYYENYNI